MKPPAFYKSRDARDALIRMMIELDFGRLACAACGAAEGKTPAVVHEENCCISYVLCKACCRPAEPGSTGTWKPGDALTDALVDSDPKVGDRVDARMKAPGAVWLLPIPEFDEGGTQ